MLRVLPCYFGGTIANRDSENYNGDRKATLICAMGGQLTLSMNITEARLNTFTQVEYTLDEYGQIDSVYPFTVIAKPTPDEIMEIGARTIIKGKIHSYLKSKDGGVKGTIVPTDPVYKQRHHLFLSKRLCRQFVEDDYPIFGWNKHTVRNGSSPGRRSCRFRARGGRQYRERPRDSG